MLRTNCARVFIASMFLAGAAMAQAPAQAPQGPPAGARVGGPPGGPPGGPRAGGPPGFGRGPVEAPVPAAVAMPRPTPADMDAARAGLARMIASTDPETRALLQKFPTLVEVRPVQNTAIVPNLAQGFVVRHQANVEVAKQGTAELLFMGDSITDWWRNETGNNAGKPVMDKYFGQWKVANFGIAGDTTQGVLFRLNDGEGAGFNPRAIMLMIGTNNTGRNSVGEIAEGVGAVVQSLQTHFPQARILLLGIFPRGAAATDPARATLADINKIISKLADGTRVQYLDIGKGFLDETGAIPKDVMGDSLHPTAKGYEIWAKAVIDPITKMMAK
ncbi:MAG: GDSL-type esterase/lipase family protein [Pseudomonadota bacterium]